MKKKHICNNKKKKRRLKVYMCRCFFLLRISSPQTLATKKMTKGKGRDPGVGGMKKHLNLKDHKERQQPKARRHLGTLEKHKDYAERAKMHHVKEGKIKVLRKKAAEKNPEEFYFGMVNGRADDKGAHVTFVANKPNVGMGLVSSG